MNSTKSIIGLSVIFLFFSQFCLGKDYEEYFSKGKTRVLQSKEYTLYGIDFSNLRLINKYKMDQGEIIKSTYCPEWLEKFDGDFTQKELKKLINVETLNDRRYPFQSDQNSKNNASTLVCISPLIMTIDTLDVIVKDYQLEEKNGIGLSMIVSELNKDDEKSIGYITFFDIASRELLFVVKVQGLKGGYGMSRHWYERFSGAWYNYFYQKFKYDKRKALRLDKKT